MVPNIFTFDCYYKNYFVNIWWKYNAFSYLRVLRHTLSKWHDVVVYTVFDILFNNNKNINFNRFICVSNKHVSVVQIKCLQLIQRSVFRVYIKRVQQPEQPHSDRIVSEALAEDDDNGIQRYVVIELDFKMMQSSFIMHHTIRMLPLYS